MPQVEVLPIWKKWSWEELLKQAAEDPARVSQIMREWNESKIPYTTEALAYDLYGYVGCAVAMRSRIPQSILNALRREMLDLRAPDAILLDRLGLRIKDYLGDDRKFARGVL